jgi:predicted nucleic acid-binding protein
VALILDTNALSAFADGDAAMAGALADQTQLAIPVVVLGEYLYGIRRSRFRKRYERWLAESANAFAILEIGVETAGHYAAIRQELRDAGSPIPTNDVWIAALAREYRCPVLTRDRHFATVKGLRIRTWPVAPAS